MKAPIVSVYDAVAEVFGRPFIVQSEGSAVRAFGDEVNRADGQEDLHKHPGDFDLYVIGHFDDSTGQVVGHAPSLLVRGAVMKGGV